MKIRQSQTKRQSRKKWNRQTKKRKQRGGDALSAEQITPILTTINKDMPLQTMINTELKKGAVQLDRTKTLTPIKNKYRASASQYHLYDLIYESQVLTSYHSKPTKIWDHGTNNSVSITAGLPGTHIYVYETPGSKFNLLGVVINNSP
jgi:hypothetical protein